MGQLPPHTLKKGPRLNQVGGHTSRHFLRKIYMNGHSCDLPTAVIFSIFFFFFFFFLFVALPRVDCSERGQGLGKENKC